MRTTSRLLLATALLTLFSATAFPQKRLCPKPPPSPFKHAGEIVTSFDSRAGGMRTSLQHPGAIANGAELFYLAASFMHQSSKRPGTPALELVLYTDAPSAQSHSGESVSLVSENQSIYVPVGAVHRLRNPGKIPLELIEVQTGSYLGEDDIVRLEDTYGRG